MYKLEYRENGTKQEIKSDNIEPLQTMLRHLFALHNDYKGSTDNFELIYFGESSD